MNRKTFFALLVGLCLCLSLAACAAVQAPQPAGPVSLTDRQGRYPLGLHIGILEDPGGELTIDQVSSPEFEAQFIPSQAVVPNYGFTDSVYWVRLPVRNETFHIDHWLLELGFANTQFVDLYTPLPDGQGFSVKQTGSLRPVTTRDVRHPHIVFDLIIPLQSQQTYFLRFQNGASMTLSLIMWTQDAFMYHSFVEQIAVGIFYGVLIGLLFYNLFLLYSLREVSYLYLVIMFASMIIQEASYDGLEIYIIPGLYSIKQYYYPFFLFVMVASMVLFSDAFLELKTRSPRFHRVDLVITSGLGVLLLLIPFVSYHFIATLFLPWALLSLLAVLTAGVTMWIKGFKPARFFLIAWFGLIASLILILLVRVGWVSSTIVSENVYRLGYIWMAVCWSIALADRINLLREEKDQSNQDLQASEARYRRLVEKMSDGLSMMDASGRFTYVNDRFGQMLGYSINEMITHPVTDFLDSTNQQILAEQLMGRRAGSSAPYELAWIRKDGRMLYTNISPMPLFEDDQTYQGSFGVITDITERVLAGRNLEQRVMDRTRELSLLLEVSQIITSNKGLDFKLNRILEQLQAVVDTCAAVIIAAEGDSWRILAYNRPSASEKMDDLKLTPAETRLVVEAFDRHQPSLLTNSAPDEAQAGLLRTLALKLSNGTPPASCSWLGLPLKEKERLIGMMILGYTEPEAFGETQIRSATAFANQAAIAITNDQLHRQTRQADVAEERNRLARDLHDSVTQVLFSASLVADVLPRIWRRDPEKGLQSLEELRRLTHGALAEMRTMLVELRPTALTQIPLGELLAQLTEAITSRTKLSFQLYIEQVPFMPEDVQTAFYRIAQEALNNVVKHAQATQVSVVLSAAPLVPHNDEMSHGEISMAIRDNGIGLSGDNQASKHFGLDIMRERAAAINATLKIDSQPGQYTEVSMIWHP